MHSSLPHSLRDVPPNNLLPAPLQLQVHSNFSRRCSSPMYCKLCSDKSLIVLANDFPFVVEGWFRPELLQASNIKVDLTYVVIHHPDSGLCDAAKPGLSSNNVWPQETFASVKLDRGTDPTFHTTVSLPKLPAKTLVSTRTAVVAAKKAFTAAGEVRQLRSGGTFSTYIRAEAVLLDCEKVQSFETYSPEVFVSGDRNLRKVCNNHYSTH